MIKQKSIFITLFLVIFSINFDSCKETSNSKQRPQQNPQEKSQKSPEEIIQKSSLYMYTTAVDGVNLRVEPTLQSRVIRVLPFLTKVWILVKSEDFVTIDGITSQWFKIYSKNNNIGWVFAGYLSKDIELPKIKNKDFIEVYRIRNVYIEDGSFGCDDLVKRLKKSYLVIYETTGDMRYIYDDNGLIESIPRFGDGVNQSEILISGLIDNNTGIPTEDNSELNDIIFITFYSTRRNEENISIHNYNILGIYEKIEL